MSHDSQTPVIPMTRGKRKSGGIKKTNWRSRLRIKGGLPLERPWKVVLIMNSGAIRIIVIMLIRKAGTPIASSFASALKIAMVCGAKISRV